MYLAEDEAVEVFDVDAIFDHFLPVSDKFVLHGCSNREAFCTVLIITLYADTPLVRVRAHPVLATRQHLAMHLGLLLIFKPHLRQPIDTTNVDPAYIGLDDSPRDLLIHDALDLGGAGWLPIPSFLTLHESDTAQAEPLFCGREAFQKVVSVAAHVHSHVAFVADD